MQWLNKVVDEAIARQPEGEILVESGVSPSGIYHVGTLREVLTCDAVLVELKRRGRRAKHIHYVDDLDPLRKIPVNVPPEFEKYLGRPYCDIPAPDGSGQSYADFFLNDFLGAAKELNMNMEVIRSHEKYRSGSMTNAIEKVLGNVDEIRRVIEEVSGRQLEKDWAPILVTEDGYLKNRSFVSIDTKVKTITYLDPDNKEQTVSYKDGEVKLNWRVDWPARWWQLGINIEPFGRDHATKGGSYDTGAAIIERVFGTEPPVPVPYQFINLIGETKKMSKSTGNIIAISQMTKILPPEVVRYFTLAQPPNKQLFFDQAHGVTKLIDDYAQLLAKKDKTQSDQQLIEICRVGSATVVSPVPFSQLVDSYQSALKDPDKTIDIIKRIRVDKIDEKLIKAELKFIDNWLENWAPEDIKFELKESVSSKDFSDKQKQFLSVLADKISAAPSDADGALFHQLIYDLKDEFGMEPKDMFQTLYQALIGKDSGPRAGWFLSILPRDWLIKRLKLDA